MTLAVLASYLLGKEMLWDTMDYHIYAGFSALHDRFGRDYFAAGPQGYFNPYAYVPFYLLLRSSLSPLVIASILAAVQSGILWLTYEVATLTAPPHAPKSRLAIGILAVALAFANPVLINQLGSSFADITTAELVLAGWLAIIAAVRIPRTSYIICGSILLGIATALKLTNAVHAVAAAPLLLFVPVPWRSRWRQAFLFVTGLSFSFALVCLPWSIRLERHFGNPFFPLLNGIFRSPEFTTAPLVDHRFIPASWWGGLLRPFKMMDPVAMVHIELSAPDLRYALLLVLALLLLIRQAWWSVRKPERQSPSPEHAASTRALAALGAGFLADWILWLAASGNSRYFIPMGCIAAVLCVALIFRLLAERPKLRQYVLAGVLGVQFFQLYAGTEYRARLPWTDGPWFSLSIPAALSAQPALYFTVGMQSNSFLIPYLPMHSGFINLDGGYVLGADGSNGARIASLIRQYSPHLRVLVRDASVDADQQSGLPNLEWVDNVLEPFGLKADADRCSTITVRGVSVVFWNAIVSPTARERHPAANTEYLVACDVRRITTDRELAIPGQRAADLAFDHLEDECPTLFQPRRPVDTLLGDNVHGYGFERVYSNTGVVAWVAHGRVWFEKLIGGREEDAGTEHVWVQGPQGVTCGFQGAGFVLFPARSTRK